MRTKLEFIAWLMRAIILAFIFYFFLIKEWTVGVFLLVFLIILSAPFIKYKLNKKFEIISFIILSLLLLHILGIIWLYKIWFFDSVIHFSWGVLLGTIVFSAFLELKKKNGIKLNLFLLGIITLAIVLLLGIGWELIEFFWDAFFKQYSQYPLAQADLADTINDLISDVLGALVSVIVLLKRQLTSKKH